MARQNFDDKFPSALSFLDTAQYLVRKNQLRHSAFELHQSIETAYSCLLLTLTNYSPPSHSLKFLRGLAEDHDRRLVEVSKFGPAISTRFTAWYNILNEAYVKARYSKHFEITDEALSWLLERTEHLLRLVEMICTERLGELERAPVRDQ